MPGVGDEARDGGRRRAVPRPKAGTEGREAEGAGPRLLRILMPLRPEVAGRRVDVAEVRYPGRRTETLDRRGTCAHHQVDGPLQVLLRQAAGEVLDSRGIEGQEPPAERTRRQRQAPKRRDDSRQRVKGGGQGASVVEHRVEPDHVTDVRQQPCERVEDELAASEAAEPVVGEDDARSVAHGGVGNPLRESHLRIRRLGRSAADAAGPGHTATDTAVVQSPHERRGNGDRKGGRRSRGAGEQPAWARLSRDGQAAARTAPAARGAGHSGHPRAHQRTGSLEDLPRGGRALRHLDDLHAGAAAGSAVRPGHAG